MQVKKQQLEFDMEQHTGSKSGKEYIKTVSHHPVYLTYSLHAAVHGVTESNTTEQLNWTEINT